MSENTLAQQMRRADIFSNLTNEQLVQISFHMQHELFQSGDIIAVKGANCSTAVLIVDGCFECTDGIGEGKQFLENQKGTVIGEMAMFIDDFEHPSTFVATSRVQALTIDRMNMVKLMENDRDLAARFIGKVASRLSEITSAVSSIEKQLQGYGTQSVKAAA